MTIGELKRERDNKFHSLSNECLMFFAFNEEQLNANKTQLEPGEKYVMVRSGTYLPKGKLEAYLSGIKIIEKWFKDTIEENKLREKYIRSVLRNYEATYTGEIEEAMEELGEEYSEEEVQAQLEILQLN